MDFQPTVIKRHPRPSKTRSPESSYWRQFKNPVFVKEYAPVTSVHFSSSQPHRYVVTAATRVQIYAPRTQKITKTISRFKDVARSGYLRQDGKLVVAGDDTGLIQVFDVNSRAILRTLNQHRQPVHVTKFSPNTPTQILSCSDDKTVKLWDIPSETPITTFIDHTDYVRSGLVSPTSPSLVLTGSYDSTIRLFDARTGKSEMTMGGAEAGQAPVESVLMFPSGGIALSTSGPILKVWDIVAGGRCIRALSNHQKSVTCMSFNANAGRLLTGGLDQMVKVYDVSTYKVVHTMRYPAPILCLAISPDDTHIATGMSDGTFSIRKRQPRASEQVASEMSKAALIQGSYEFFMAGGTLGIGTTKVKGAHKVKEKQVRDTNELRVESRRRTRLRKYDRLLKDFQYSAALDSILQKNVLPATAFSVIAELIHRDGLRTALNGRDDVMLEPVLALLIRHISDPRFGEMACDATGIVIEMYASILGQSPLIDRLFEQLQRKVDQELKFQQEVLRMKGALNMVLASASLIRS